MKRIIVAFSLMAYGMTVHDEPRWFIITILVVALMSVFHDPYPWHRPHAAPVATPAPTIAEVVAATTVQDEDAVRALMTLGFKRKAAIEALNSTGWKGDTTEMRVVHALRAKPPVQ